MSEISVHPSWSGTAGIYSSSDVALLTLDTEVDTCPIDTQVTRVPGRLQRHGAAGVSARHPRPQLRGRGGRGHGLGQAGHRGLPPAAHGGQGEVLISTHYLQYLHTIYTGQGGGHLQPGVQGHLARGPGVS